MILGAEGEKTRLPGGMVVNLGSPLAVASALVHLLRNEKFYKQCSRTIKTRVQKHYSKADQRRAYADLYESFVGPKGTLETEVVLQDNAA
jgi:glycosyltransferase involved in cell wall biosynthesis